MPKIVILRGLTPSEFLALKKDLPTFATLRTHKQKYAYRAVDIRPRKGNGYQFSPEQFQTLRTLVEKHQLVDTSPDIWNGSNAYYCYMSGLNYFYKEGK